jgi:hypothetical protein
MHGLDSCNKCCLSEFERDRRVHNRRFDDGFRMFSKPELKLCQILVDGVLRGEVEGEVFQEVGLDLYVFLCGDAV